MNIRVGFGFDVHAIEEGRPFYLGGIKLEHSKGMIAHSDGDVLIHSICDALLGASGMRDIGIHFPNNSEEFKGIDSKELLKRTIELIQGQFWYVINVDSTVCAESPKLNKHIPEMSKVLSSIMNIEPDACSIKATTNEKLGFIGREEGIAVYSVALIAKKQL